jgi:hypothetical protein
MAKENLNITPSVTVHKLLEVYPELEDVLIGIAPPFKKLKNPFLRRSVAKVATIKHISSVGKVPLNELINTLRKAAGQTEMAESYEDEEYFQAKPAWFSAEKISVSIDEDRLEDKDKMTLTVIFKEAKNIEKGEIIELVTTFLPAPGIDIMKSKGYSVWASKSEGNLIRTYFLKS